MAVDKGKASREVVQQLITDMTDFKNYVEGEIQSMISQTNRLGESWNDPQYAQFSAFIDDLTNSLKKDLAVFEEATNSLRKKLSMYD